MTAMRRIRKWAEDNGLELKVERRIPDTESGGSWRIAVRLEESVLFEAYERLAGHRRNGGAPRARAADRGRRGRARLM